MDDTKNIDINGGDYLNNIDDQTKPDSFNDTFNHNDFNFENNQINDKAISKASVPSPATYETNKQKVLIIMGLRRSGKSSVQKVVFEQLTPNETLFLEPTNRIIKDEISASSFIKFSIYNFPGQMNFSDQSFSDDIFLGISGAVVFIIDAQDDYTEAISTFLNVVQRVYKLNQNIIFEVFIHKVDCVSDDSKLEIQRDIYSRVKDDLIDIDLEFVKISYHLTSIYDHSIFEAFSKVVQKLIPQLPVLENLLDIFISSCQIEKAFLFDVVSKIYIATDGSPVDFQSYELACDMIDCVIDISNLYSIKETDEPNTSDKNLSSIIKLNNNTVLYLREVNNYLALVCILREENFDKKGVIDFNFQCFKEAIQDVFNSKPDELVQLNGENDGQSSLKEFSKDYFNDSSSSSIIDNN